MEITEKRTYNYPEIVCIVMDNEISLALASTPPVGPDEGSLAPEYMKNNPFKNNMG